jgi:threonine dehydrogenase-like Zn-dependent dehydrogenase
LQALVFTAASQVELRDEPEPEPAAGEVLVTVRASAICGSELHGFRSVGFRTPPLVMGHEFAGTTPDGTRVVVNPLVTCGACPACAGGRPQVCASRALLGVHRPGGFAEQVAVPVASLSTLPDAMGWTSAALVEPLANAVHAWRLADPGSGSVAIVGAGPIGLVCLLVAQQHGARQVTVVDPAPARRAVAGRLGAVVAASLGDQTFDATFDAVGLAATRAAAVSHTRPGGTSLWLGLAGTDAGFDGADLVRYEKRVLGSFAYTPEDFAEALLLAQSVDLSWATEVPMSEAERVFMELADGRTDITKAVLRLGEP